MESVKQSATRVDARRARDGLRACAAIAGLPASEFTLGPRLVGGRNNQVFEIHGGQRELCIKFFRDARRDGFHREVSLLRALAAMMGSKVPALIAADEGSASVLMSKVPGRPLTAGTIAPGSAAGVLASLQQLYAIDPDPLHLSDVPWPPLRMFTRTGSMIGETLGEHARSEWEAHADRLGVPALLGPENRRSCIGRGDPALDNILWDGDVASLVDFESGGQSDVAHEVAEFLEHPQQRLLDRGFRAALVDRILRPEELLCLAASRWLLRSFWSVRSAGTDLQRDLTEVVSVESLSAPWWR